MAHIFMTCVVERNILQTSPANGQRFDLNKLMSSRQKLFKMKYNTEVPLLIIKFNLKLAT